MVKEKMVKEKMIHEKTTGEMAYLRACAGDAKASSADSLVGGDGEVYRDPRLSLNRLRA